MPGSSLVDQDVFTTHSSDAGQVIRLLVSQMGLCVHAHEPNRPLQHLDK